MSNADSSSPWTLIGFLLVAGWATQSKSTPKEVTDYRLVCTTTASAGVCSGRELPLGKITYRPAADERSITLWNEGMELDRYDSCIVRDSENWSCNGSASEPFQHSMREGRLTTHQNSIVYSTSWWRWWFLTMREWVSTRTK